MYAVYKFYKEKMYIYTNPKVFSLFLMQSNGFNSYLEANMTSSFNQLVDLSKLSANINGQQKKKNQNHIRVRFPYNNKIKSSIYTYIDNNNLL